MKKFFLFVAALIVAVSMNVRAAETPDNIGVLELLGKMVTLQGTPMPGSSEEKLLEMLAIIEEAKQSGEEVNWDSIYTDAKECYETVENGANEYKGYAEAIEAANVKLQMVSPYSANADELKALIETATRGYNQGTLEDNEDTRKLFEDMEAITDFPDKVALSRNVVGTELRTTKATSSVYELSMAVAEGTGVTVNATKSTSNCYVSGVKMTAAPYYYTPTKKNTLQDAIDNNIWIGGKLVINDGCTMSLESIKVHLGSGTNNYIWDFYLYNEEEEIIYYTEGGYKIQNYNSSKHSNDEVTLADSALKAQVLEAGTYEARIYLYGNKNNDILLKELSFTGAITGGTTDFGPEVNMPYSLASLVEEANKILYEPMYSQYSYNLGEAIEIATNDTCYKANYAYLQGAYDAALASIADYAELELEIVKAQLILDEGEGKEGAADLKKAIDAAQQVYDNGSAKSTASNLTTLKIAENAFYVAGASEQNPKDATMFISNADFTQDIDSATNWYIAYDPSKIDYSICEPNGENGFSGNYIEAVSEKKFQGYTISQTLVNIPNGDYKFTAKVLGLEGTNNNKGTLKLYANDKNATCSRGAQAKETSVYVRVTDNTLKLVFTETDNRNNTVDFGDVKLEYYNFRSWASIKENSTSYTVTINSQESFDDAWKKTDWAAGKDVNFVLANGTYDLGVNVGRAFPQTFADFNIVAASGAKPVLSGSLRSTGMKLKNYKVEGITFHNYTGSTSTDLSPLHFAKGQKDTVMNEVIVRNCQFDSLPACLIRLNAGNDTEKYIHSIIVENNTIDGIAHHFFQFAGGRAFGLANFTFRENVVKNMYADGGQLFNTPLSTKHPASDTIYTMTVENNAFYKIGGCATAARNFLECNKDNDWAEVYINFNNNIFYDQYNWDAAKYSESNVAMFNKKENQIVELNFLKNVVAPANAYTNSSLSDSLGTQPFPVTSGNIAANYDLITVDTAEFAYTPDTKMLQTNPYFTGGVGGTYIGPRNNYYDFNMENADYVVDNVAAFTQALEYFNTVDNNKDLTVYFKDCADECGYYALEMTARNFPQKFGDITFKPYEGAKPQISGSFRSGNGMKVNTYTVENLNFVEGNMNGKTDASPLYFHKGVRDSVMNEVIIRNCTFTDMPACMIRLNASNDNKYIHSIIVENNVVDGIAHHLFQFASGQNFGLANFTFRENIVKNMYATGGQFFNTHISKNHPANDSIYTMTVDHNTFYKIGGMSTADRKFLECNTNNDWKEVYINFTNNVFYDRYSWKNSAESDVALFVTDTVNSQIAEVNFLKNVLAPLNVMANADVEKYGNISFPVISGNITPTYDHISSDTTDFWLNEDKLILGWNDDIYYTSGVGNTYVGAKACYLVIPDNAKYFWQSPSGTPRELNGKAVAKGDTTRVNYYYEYTCFGKAIENYTICLNGKKDLADGKYIELSLEQPLSTGDTILITAFRNKGYNDKGEQVKSKARFFYGNEKTDYFDDGTDGLFYNDMKIDSIAGPNTQSFIVPAAANDAMDLKITRGETGTNLFITKLVILKGNSQNAPAVDGIEEVSTINGIFANNGVLYINLNEASMVKVYDMTGRALKSVNAVEGLNAIEGLNEGQIYIVRTDNEIVKIAL